VTVLAQGPAWTEVGLDVRAGRYPLSVERHVMRMADHLVPGVTTVTPHARYYCLHALVATEVQTQDLTLPAAQDLLRRTEVALATVSWAHQHGEIGLPRAHGIDALAGWLNSGEVDMATASQSGSSGYAESPWGFWNPYVASEVTLGILASGKLPTPGDRCDTAAVQAGLGELLELARRDRLAVDEVASLGATLCVCAGGRAPDGEWLARLLCAPEASNGVDKRVSSSRGATRRGTIRLLRRVVQTHPVAQFTRDIAPVIAFGDFATADEVASRLTVTPLWQGVVLRNYAVGAWRRLWSWLVDQVTGLTPATEVADRFADDLPGGTVAQFLDSLPATMTAAGLLAPAELGLRASDTPLPVTELGVLAIGAQRTNELSGRVADAFLGQRGVELGPEWMARRLNEAQAWPVRDFARQLVRDLLGRAQRVALAKARRRTDGSLWLPTRLHERGGLLFRTSREGRGDVGLRLDQLGTVLAGAGLLRFGDDRWVVTAAGEVLLD
jgi:hypothetical protein